jgi:bisphosphoglycerate-independent phosphoglycerate mutase (AlkP superfamily)
MPLVRVATDRTDVWMAGATDNDTLIFFNYRSDRMREIVETMGAAAKHFETDTVRQGLVRHAAMPAPSEDGCAPPGPSYCH